MQMVLQTEKCGRFVRSAPVRQLDMWTRLKAQEQFNKYRDKGVILGGAFEDNQWKMTDQLHIHTLDFSFDAALFQREAEEWAGCTAECYLECMKAFIAFQFGRYRLPHFRELIGLMRTLAGLNVDAAGELPAQELNSHITEFLSLIPVENDLRDLVIERFEEQKWGGKTTQPRKLTDFKGYLRFNHALDIYWQSASQDGKKFYFPVYFWWKLTAILPLRCTEFLLTPRDCVHKDGNLCLLSIRRSRLKKGGRRLSYTVEHDYVTQKYEIPAWLFEEIRWYQNATAGAKLPKIKTLLVPEFAASSRYFSYLQMTNRLQQFYREIMRDESCQIRLGDTRHLAMINLMLSGGSPVICRELAGHESIDVSSHYYANLSSVVESAVYECCHGWTERPIMEGSLRLPPALSESRVRVDDGWCDVPVVAQGDVSECLKCCDSSGRIGTCINCPHFYPDSPGLRIQIEKSRKKAVDEDSRFLMQMIEQVRKGLGYEEEIGAAFLRLQSSVQRYSSALAGKYMEVKENGKTQED